MKKIIFLLLVAYSTVCINAQLRVSYNSLQLSSFTLSNFNDVTITSSLDASTDIRCLLRTDDGTMICELFFKGKKIRTGQNKLNYSEAAIKYCNNIYADLLKQNILNKGDLELCVETHDDNEILKDVEQCFPIDFLTPTPIELSIPENKITLKIDRPEFGWIPPIPTLQNTKYHIVVVVKNENQTCLEAINQNMSLINKKDIITTQINFPSEAQSLEQNKEYCWRVSAYSNNMEYSRSEEWIMKLGGEEKEKNIPLIEELNNKSIVNDDGNISFYIDNKKVEKELKIKIYKINEKGMFIYFNEEIHDLKYGKNLIVLEKENFKNSGKYKIEIKDLNNKEVVWFINIK